MTMIHAVLRMNNTGYRGSREIINTMRAHAAAGTAFLTEQIINHRIPVL
jgi:hypothetical protein